MSASTELTSAEIWIVIIGLGLATYLIRFSFLGLMGGRAPSPFVEKLLRYVPAAVLPALIAPMVAIDRETGGVAAPEQIIAACVAVGVGVLSRNVLATIAAGMGTLWALTALGL
ncbi:MAG: AzlD domain-containing protein [Pseudomonadota bacterium]